MTSYYDRTYALNTKIARCIAFVGSYLPMDKHFAIGNLLKDALTGNSIVINGDGSPIRIHLYSANLAVRHWRILLDGGSGDIFNVGGDKQI
jgi:dTDP-D-glucose 4,6-dehydratase